MAENGGKWMALREDNLGHLTTLVEGNGAAMGLPGMPTCCFLMSISITVLRKGIYTTLVFAYKT